MHRLVSIGRSVTQGMKSFAVLEPQFSYPAIIAHEMGLSEDEFRYPYFSGKGSLPMNIEYLLRKLDQTFGENVNFLELPFAAFLLREWMDEIEDYWERGPGTPPINYEGNFHNLAVWSFEVQDSYQVTAKLCQQIISQNPPSDNWIKQIPEHAMLSMARRILNPSHSSDPEKLKASQVERATDMARKDGIENLVINLGANNILLSVVDLVYEESDEWTVKQKNPEFRSETHHPNKKHVTVYTPKHYEQLLDRLMLKVEQMNSGKGVKRVFWGTVPPVTIFPVCRGVGGRMNSSEELQSPYGDRDRHHPDWYRRYFKFYTRPWISDARFDSEVDPHLTGKEIIRIDGTISIYNELLKDKVDQHNQRRKSAGKVKDWFIIDFHKLLDELAFRRYQEDPSVPRPDGWQPYKLPPEYEKLNLDTRFLRSRQGQLVAGGLFSLDGVHPTTVGSGIVAQEVIDEMQRRGVEFYKLSTGKQKIKRNAPIKVDYARLVRLDTLITKLPSTMDDLWDRLQDGDEILDVFNRAFKGIAKHF
jgi:hypothetical protein